VSFFPSGVSNTTITGSTDTKVTTPVIANVACLTASTEYSYALPSGTRFFRLRVRGSSQAQLAFVSGQSGTVYLTVDPGFTYESPLFPVDSSITTYFQCYKASQTVEIESWS
jgi:hypothetical protein